MPPLSAGALPANIGDLLATAWRAAQHTSSGAPVKAIQLVKRDGIAKALVTVTGGQPRTLAFDAQTGIAVADWATGLALLYLVVSGGVMYLRSRRR